MLECFDYGFDILKKLFFGSLLLGISAAPYCLAPYFFRTVFFHERCHWRMYYIFRKCKKKRTDCIIMINEELYDEMSKKKRERIRRFVCAQRRKRGLRVGVRPSNVKASMATCHTPLVDYHNKKDHFLEEMLSLIAPYYGCSWQIIPIVLLMVLWGKSFFMFRAFQIVLICIGYYVITPIVLIMLDGIEQSGKQMRESVNIFFARLNTCKNEKEIRECISSFPAISDAYKLKHIKWYIDVKEKYVKEIKEICLSCGIPYIEGYDEIATRLEDGTYHEL